LLFTNFDFCKKSNLNKIGLNIWQVSKIKQIAESLTDFGKKAINVATWEAEHAVMLAVN